MISYPAIYYFVYPHARYRHPIEPELTILIVFLILEAREAKKPEPQRTRSNASEVLREP
jgi:hypothetical protein